MYKCQRFHCGSFYEQPIWLGAEILAQLISLNCLSNDTKSASYSGALMHLSKASVLKSYFFTLLPLQFKLSHALNCFPMLCSLDMTV